MAKTSLIIETTDTSGKKLQKTFTDVNPEASSADLVTFAQMCNGLTSNTYVRTDRIDKINCDSELYTAKATPTLEFGNKGSYGNWYAQINYNGDGVLTASAKLNDQYVEKCTIRNDNGQLMVIIISPDAGSTYDVTVCATETANYKYASISTTLNGGNN